jgi:hypothetical protein
MAVIPLVALVVVGAGTDLGSGAQVAMAALLGLLGLIGGESFVDHRTKLDRAKALLEASKQWSGQHRLDHLAEFDVEVRAVPETRHAVWLLLAMVAISLGAIALVWGPSVVHMNVPVMPAPSIGASIRPT